MLVSQKISQTNIKNPPSGISAGEQSLTSEALESLKGVVADDAMVQTRETEVFLDDALKKISSADSERKKLSEVFDDLEKLLDSISCSESNEKVNCALLEQAFGTE